MADKNTVVIVHETVLQGWARDAGTAALIMVLIGIGWLIGSSALQWVGAVIAFITIVQRASGRVQRLTMREARQKLDELEREATHG